jgi:hypothetical protein
MHRCGSIGTHIRHLRILLIKLIIFNAAMSRELGFFYVDYFQNANGDQWLCIVHNGDPEFDQLKEMCLHSYLLSQKPKIKTDYFN